MAKIRVARRRLSDINNTVNKSTSTKRWCLISANERRLICRALGELKSSCENVSYLCINNQPEVDILTNSIRNLQNKFCEENWRDEYVNNLPKDIKVPGLQKEVSTKE